MKIKRIYKILFFEIAILGLICTYFLINSSDIYGWYTGSADFVKQDRACNLHKEICTVSLKDGSKMSLSISPRTITLLKPVKFQVKTEGIDVDTLELKIYATNMNMGYHVTSLKKLKKNLYEGNVTLQSCIIGNMRWNANIIANKTGESFGAIFEFKTN